MQLKKSERSIRWATRRARCAAGAAAAALGLCAAPAFADDAADLATARIHGVEGINLADAGKCREAIEKLSRAETLHHAPTTAARLGECEIEVGKLVSGTERLNRVVREPLGPNPPAAFTTAVSRAQKVLDLALPRVATLRISLQVPPGAKFAVAIDGERVPGAVAEGLRQIDPGVHHVEVTAPGYLAASTDASLGEGETVGVNLELKPDPHGAAARAAAEGRPVGAEAKSSGPGAGPFVAFGIGAAAIGLGVVSAVMVANKSSSLDEVCSPEKICPESSQSEIRDARTWATVSTVSFIAGGAGIVTGAVLLLTSGSSRASSKTVGQRSPRVQPVVGAGSVGLRGVF